MESREKAYIIEGVRTPFVKAGKELRNFFAHQLGRLSLTELLYKSDCDPGNIEAVIFGNVAQPAEVSNIARVIALTAGLRTDVNALTLQQNCATGMQTVITASERIRFGLNTSIVCGAVDSVSNIPLKTNRHMSEFYAQLASKGTLLEKLSVMKSFRPEYFQPVVAIAEYLKDGYTGLSMGHTAEISAKLLRISREEQDLWALRSHKRAEEGQNNSLFQDEVFPIFIGPDYKTVLTRDNSVRYNQSAVALKKLKPVFDREIGSVTKGNMAPLVDGAAALMLMSGERAKADGFTPEFFIRAVGHGALPPQYMGIAPVLAIHSILTQEGLSLKDIDLFEINEIFASHLLSVFQMIKDPKRVDFLPDGISFADELDREKVNVNGGTIAIGHALSVSSARIIIHLMKEMRRRDLSLGIAATAANGGQGLALLIERS